VKCEITPRLTHTHSRSRTHKHNRHRHARTYLLNLSTFFFELDRDSPPSESVLGRLHESILGRIIRIGVAFLTPMRVRWESVSVWLSSHEKMTVFLRPCSMSS
jgi:hypothetical protein